MQHRFSTSSNQEVLRKWVVASPLQYSSNHSPTMPAAGLLLALLWFLLILLLTTVLKVCLESLLPLSQRPPFPAALLVVRVYLA